MNKNANLSIFTRLLCKKVTLHQVVHSVAPCERAIIDVGGSYIAQKMRKNESFRLIPYMTHLNLRKLPFWPKNCKKGKKMPIFDLKIEIAGI